MAGFSEGATDELPRMGGGASAAALPATREEALAAGYTPEQIDAHIQSSTTPTTMVPTMRLKPKPTFKMAAKAVVAFQPTREQIRSASAAAVAKPYRRPTPLRDAIKAGDMPQFTLLLEDEAMLEEINFADPADGSTCLFEAVFQVRNCGRGERATSLRTPPGPPTSSLLLLSIVPYP